MFLGFPTRSNTNQAVQPQKMATGLKVFIKKLEGLYYLCSENKGADQLPGYYIAVLHLCFSICKKQVFPRCSSFEIQSNVQQHNWRMILQSMDTYYMSRVV